MIPFNKSTLEGREIEQILRSALSGAIAGDQQYSKKSERLLEEVFKSNSSAKITTSCTHALEISAMLLDIKPGDEVIVPSFTFVSTASAFAMRGAEIKFIDVRPDTLNLDESKLETAISTRTKAIVPVHYAGVGCEMDTIMAIANRHGIAVVEDNAHGLFGKYKGQPLGTFGRFATQSFHETKNITCGEGGAIVLNNPEDIELCEIIREKGTNRTQFFRGQVDKYSWRELGSSYVMSDILAAFLHAQLEAAKQIQAKRAKIWNFYDQELASWTSAFDIKRPTIPTHCEQAYHMYYMLLPDLESRTRFLAHLRTNGVHAVFHYLPLHLSDYAVRRNWNNVNCPVSVDVSERLVRLPLYTSLSLEEQQKVVAACQSFKL
jgi:dTDP-4-amino-4,6-dideoxygalactose transaminase